MFPVMQRGHPARSFLFLFDLLLITVWFLSAAGCQPAKPPALSQIGNGIAAAEAYRDTAYKHADQPAIVRSSLGDDGQKRSLAEASLALVKAEKDIAAERDLRLRIEGELRQERDQWLGDRGKAYIWWIVGSTFAVWAGIGLFGTFLSVATGGTSVWAGFIFKLIPLGGLFAGLTKKAV